MIAGLHHVNIIIPPSPDHSTALALATSFYAQTLGLTLRPVPAAQKDRLAWFDIGTSGQQVHVAFGRPDIDFTPLARQASRHPCFRVENLEKLRELQERVWGHFLAGRDEQGQEQEQEGGRSEVEEEMSIRKASAPMDCDEPGKENSGDKGPEYPSRFFARDFAGNRLEFTV
ncbi:hypothetical protein V8F20_005971 [Naviculisporaceae sp. PSN 640]